MGQIPVVIAVWISETKKGRNANKLQCKTIYCLDCDNSFISFYHYSFRVV